MKESNREEKRREGAGEKEGDEHYLAEQGGWVCGWATPAT
jgi:hypothetical protein